MDPDQTARASRLLEQSDLDLHCSSKFDILTKKLRQVFLQRDLS